MLFFIFILRLYAAIVSSLFPNKIPKQPNLTLVFNM